MKITSATIGGSPTTPSMDLNAPVRAAAEGTPAPSSSTPTPVAASTAVPEALSEASTSEAKARPSEKGPVFIKTTSAGLQEVAAGRKVKLSLENGSTLVGVLKLVSKDGVVLDLGGSGELVVWAPEIKQITKAD